MIREAALSDASRIAEINVYGWRNAYRGLISDKILYSDFSVERAIEKYKKVILEGKSGIYVFEDELTGIIKAMMGFYEYSDEQIYDALELNFLYVETAFCGQGIGSKMIQYFEKAGLDAGVSTLVVYTLERNTQARRFYEKHGYVCDGNSKYIDWLELIDLRYQKKLRYPNVKLNPGA